MYGNCGLKEYRLTDLVHMKIHGRTTGCLTPLTLFWTGSAVELNVKGSEFWIEVEADQGVYEPWITIVIDSYPVSRQMVTAGRHWICIFRGMNEAIVKNLRFIKETQPMSFDNGCLLHIHSVRIDGEFLPVEDKPIKIEFIGDSITSGEGTAGSKCEQDWIPMWFSVIDNYTAMTAAALNADYRVISQSGWGVLTGWDNNPRANIPQYYDMTCGILQKENCKVPGAFEKNAFDEWQPDIVVVNLGTNDASAFHSPEWTDAASGERHKQRLNEDGTYNEEDLKAFEKAVIDFLKKIRTYNRKAHIVWAYGMAGLALMPALYRAVNEYVRLTGDRKASVFQLPNTTEETMGSRSHPGKPAHEKAAKELANYLMELLSR